MNTRKAFRLMLDIIDGTAPENSRVALEHELWMMIPVEYRSVCFRLGLKADEIAFLYDHGFTEYRNHRRGLGKSYKTFVRFICDVFELEVTPIKQTPDGPVPPAFAMVAEGVRSHLGNDFGNVRAFVGGKRDFLTSEDLL